MRRGNIIDRKVRALERAMQREICQLPQGEIARETVEREYEEYLAHLNRARRYDAHGCIALPSWEWSRAPFPAVRGLDDGHNARLDRLRCLGNGVVPACAREAFAYLAGLGCLAA